MRFIGTAELGDNSLRSSFHNYLGFRRNEVSSLKSVAYARVVILDNTKSCLENTSVLKLIITEEIT